MKNLATGKAQLMVIRPESLTSGTGMEIVGAADDIISIIWTKKFNECDTFEIVVPTTQENMAMYVEDNIVVINDFQIQPDTSTDDWTGSYKYTDTAGIIEKIDVKSPSQNGDLSEMTISGRSMESLLDRRIVWEATNVVIYDGTAFAREAGALYQNFIMAMYQFIADEIIAPGAPDPNKKKSKKNIADAVEFQNRAIWNMVMGDFGPGTGSDSTPESQNCEEFFAKLMPEGQGTDKKSDDASVVAFDFEGESLLEAVHKICSTFGIGLRAYLLLDVDMPLWQKTQAEQVGDYLYMAFREYKHILAGRTMDAMNDERQLDIPDVCSWIFLEFHVPVNRSYLENDKNQYVVFSQNLDNLKDVQFVKNSENIKNITRIMGEDKGEKTQYATAYYGKVEPSGWNRKEIFTDASNITQEKKGKKYLNNIYIPALEAAGRTTLAENSRNKNYMFDGVPIIGLDHQVYEYGKDYYIGDYVQFYDSVFFESARVQISEICETLDSSGYDISMAFEMIALGFAPAEDPLSYYWYTVDDEAQVITITGIKIRKIIDDGLSDLSIFESDTEILDNVRRKTGKMKTINKGVEARHLSLNPNYNQALSSEILPSVNDNAYSWGVTPHLSINASKYKNYHIELDLTYSE